MRFDWPFFWNSLFTPSGPFLDGLVLTIVISVVAMVLALIVGFAIALMRRSRFTGLRWFASVYIWVIRGQPGIDQHKLHQQRRAADHPDVDAGEPAQPGEAGAPH